MRRANFYDHMDARPASPRNLTPYYQTIEDCVIQEIADELEESSDYRRRRQEIRAWNATSPILKRGIALTPVKFGISFTNTMMNQAGALVHVYTDGSIALNHGGTEMGQGLNTKVAQVVAEEFQVDIDRIKITATTTGKVPNTSPTAASSGSDLNGMAARNAAAAIKARLVAFLAERHQAEKTDVVFLPNRIRIKEHEISFDEAIGEAYKGRIHLSAAGFYATPKIHWDRASAKGRPFFYFAYGAAVSEVAIDTLTGENRILRTDILHDVGQSLNPALDLGQIEGGFVQGAGWLTMEELVWDAEGPAHDARAFHLQDPRLLRPPDRPAAEAVGQGPQRRGHHLPLQGRGRAASHAGHLRADGVVGRGGERGRLCSLSRARLACDARADPDDGRAHQARDCGSRGLRTPMSWIADIAREIAEHGAIVRVTVIRADGSTPRETGAAMLVGAGHIRDTIGGGALELEAIAHARGLIANAAATPPLHRRRRLRCKEGGGWNATDLARQSRRSTRLPTGELSPMAFLVGVTSSRLQQALSTAERRGGGKAA